MDNIDCKNCKNELPILYKICHTDECRNKIIEEFGIYCIWDIIDIKVKEMLENQFNNMATVDDILKQLRK